MVERRMAFFKALVLCAFFVCALICVFGDSRKCGSAGPSGKYIDCKQFCCGTPEHIECRDKGDCGGVPCDKNDDCGSGCCVEGMCKNCPLPKTYVVLIIIGALLVLPVFTIAVCCCCCPRKKATLSWNQLN